MTTYQQPSAFKPIDYLHILTPEVFIIKYYKKKVIKLQVITN